MLLVLRHNLLGLALKDGMISIKFDIAVPPKILPSSYVSGLYSSRISPFGTPIILIEVFLIFLRSYKEMFGYYYKLDHDHFLLSLKFIIHSHPIRALYNLS